MAAFFRHPLLRRLISSPGRHRLISTSKNAKSDATPLPSQCAPKTDVVRQTDKNWVSYGFDHKNKDIDRAATAMIFFTSVTLMLVIGSVYIAYLPDYTLQDWAQREAFLELRRREEAGLPLIDPNLIDPAKIVLPSDEELGDTEIII